MIVKDSYWSPQFREKVNSIYARSQLILLNLELFRLNNKFDWIIVVVRFVANTILDP